MAPSTVRRKTLSELRKAFTAMMSPEWDRALEGRSEEELTRAGRTLLALQRARLRLANAKLAGIRDRLVENEAELAAAAARLDDALARLRDVGTVLEAAASLLRTVGRIVDLIV